MHARNESESTIHTIFSSYFFACVPDTLFFVRAQTSGIRDTVCDTRCRTLFSRANRRRGYEAAHSSAASSFARWKKGRRSVRAHFVSEPDTWRTKNKCRAHSKPHATRLSGARSAARNTRGVGFECPKLSFALAESENVLDSAIFGRSSEQKLSFGVWRLCRF